MIPAVGAGAVSAHGNRDSGTTQKSFLHTGIGEGVPFIAGRNPIAVRATWVPFRVWR